MERLEIVRPDALKRVMSNLNGSARVLTSVELARMKLNWPITARPPVGEIMKAARDLVSLANNPPPGFNVDEVPTSPSNYMAVKIKKVH